MPTPVVMPQMGESLSEGTVTRWLKKVGEKITRDEPLFEISTDKVDTEVPAPDSGVLEQILVREGETVAVGTVVATIGAGEARQEAYATSGAQTRVPPSPPAGSGGHFAPTHEPTTFQRKTPPSGPGAATAVDRKNYFSPAVLSLARERQAPLGEISQIQGTGAGGRITKKDVERYLEQRTSAPPPQAAYPPPPSVAVAQTSVPPAPGAYPASPPAQGAYPPPSPAQAAYPQPPPAQPAYPAAPPAQAAYPPPPPGPAYLPPPPGYPWPAYPYPLYPVPIAPGYLPPSPQAAPDQTLTPAPGSSLEVPAAYLYEPGPEDRVIPMSAMRKKIAEHMIWSQRISAQVTSFTECDMHRIVRYRDEQKAAFEASEGIPLTFLPFVAEATVKAIKEIPIFNASVLGEQIVLKKHVHLGVAVALEEGLIVPVVRNADEMNFVGLARAIHDLASRARSKQLSVEEVQGATFTITNPGIFGGLTGTPMISQPQVAILGLGAVAKKPVVVEDAIAIRPIMVLALTFDHRIIDGATGFQFIERVRSNLEHFEFP